MKHCPKCDLDKDESEFQKSARTKSGLQVYCKQCVAAYAKANRARIKAYKAKYHAENREMLLAQKKTHYEANKSVYVERATKRNKANPGGRKAACAKYYRENTSYYRAKENERRANQLSATPVWSDKNYVDGMYSICGIMNAVRGAGTYSVDHIVPLKSKLVCGLHAHTNLTIMLTSANKSKNNRHWPDMP